MTYYIAWGVTGAGHFLSEVFLTMKKIKKLFNVKITTFTSKAGEEVLRIYGFLPKIKEVSPGNYYEEFFCSGSAWSFPVSGRLQLGKYNLLVIAPCSANTTAKIVHGIADTMVTNVFAQAQKGKIPTYILPTDWLPSETELPPMVNRDVCRGCKPCPPMEKCPYGAFEFVEGKARINLEKCWGCGLCVSLCPYKAVSFRERVKVTPRKIDVENVEKLCGFENVKVLRSPKELENLLFKFLEGKVKP